MTTCCFDYVSGSEKSQLVKTARLIWWDTIAIPRQPSEILMMLKANMMIHVKARNLFVRRWATWNCRQNPHEIAIWFKGLFFHSAVVGYFGRSSISIMTTSRTLITWRSKKVKQRLAFDDNILTALHKTKINYHNVTAQRTLGHLFTTTHKANKTIYSGSLWPLV